MEQNHQLSKMGVELDEFKKENIALRDELLELENELKPYLEKKESRRKGNAKGGTNSGGVSKNY